ncbi:unnamed protein product [Caretta caretta]
MIPRGGGVRTKLILELKSSFCETGEEASEKIFKDHEEQKETEQLGGADEMKSKGSQQTHHPGRKQADENWRTVPKKNDK